MHPDKSAAVIGLLDLRPGITPEDFEKALEELDVDKVLDASRTARVRTEQGQPSWSPPGVQASQIRVLASTWRPNRPGVTLIVFIEHGL